MSFLAVLFALMIEQLKPLPRDNPVRRALVQWADWTLRNLDAGQTRHAWVVWTVTVGVPTLVVLGLHVWIAGFSLLLALAFNVAVLFVTLGFRQFSHYFTDIREALESGSEERARRLLAEWRQLDASEMPRTEVLRQVIEHALLAAHRHVLGVFFWFVVLSALGLGPAGAVVYRLAEFVARHWARRARSLPDGAGHERLIALSRRLFDLIDHVPARLTAFGFAVVGNFEEAINGWRRDAELWPRQNEGVILAAAAGAVGVQLGGHAPAAEAPTRRAAVAPAPRAPARRAPEFDEALYRAAGIDDDPALSAADVAAAATPGAPPRLGHLSSVVGLVWRSVVLWMLLVALLTLANVLA